MTVKHFFFISNLANVKISLPIFIYENKLFMFYNVSFFFSQIIILQEIHSFIFAN